MGGGSKEACSHCALLVAMVNSGERRRHRCWWALTGPHFFFLLHVSSQVLSLLAKDSDPKTTRCLAGELEMASLKSLKRWQLSTDSYAIPPFPAPLCLAPSSSASPNLSTSASGELTSGFPRTLQLAFPSYHFPSSSHNCVKINSSNTCFIP